MARRARLPGLRYGPPAPQGTGEAVRVAEGAEPDGGRAPGPPAPQEAHRYDRPQAQGAAGPSGPCPGRDRRLRESQRALGQRLRTNAARDTVIAVAAEGGHPEARAAAGRDGTDARNHLAGPQEDPD